MCWNVSSVVSSGWVSTNGRMPLRTAMRVSSLSLARPLYQPGYCPTSENQLIGRELSGQMIKACRFPERRPYHRGPAPLCRSTLKIVMPAHIIGDASSNDNSSGMGATASCGRQGIRHSHRRRMPRPPGRERSLRSHRPGTTDIHGQSRLASRPQLTGRAETR